MACGNCGKCKCPQKTMYAYLNVIDGPYVVTDTGDVKWLTFFDRFKLWAGLVTEQQIVDKYNH